MNKTKIDKLFEEKLASFEVRPSANAWERIEPGIGKKVQNKGRYIWYAAAASITVALTTAVLMTGTVVNKENLTVQNESTENEETVAVIEIEDQIQTAQISPEVDAPGTTLTKDFDQEKINIKDNQTTWVAVINTEIENFEMTEKQDLLSPVGIVPLSIQKQNFKIVTVSVRFNPSFELIPTDDLANNALPRESGFKKIYQYAKRVKNGEESLFNLRKAKEDLFAMAKNIKLNKQSKPN